jgi:hypothetical protein
VLTYAIPFAGISVAAVSYLSIRAAHKAIDDLRDAYINLDEHQRKGLVRPFGGPTLQTGNALPIITIAVLLWIAADLMRYNLKFEWWLDGLARNPLTFAAVLIGLFGVGLVCVALASKGGRPVPEDERAASPGSGMGAPPPSGSTGGSGGDDPTTTNVAVAPRAGHDGGEE